MPYIDPATRKALGFVPTETGVYEYIDGTRWVAVYVYPSGGSAVSTHRTEAEALAKLAEEKAFTAEFWAEKITWANQGDRVDPEGPRNVIRVGGWHSIPEYEGVRPGGGGMGGRVIRWRWLDEPEGTVHETNSLWSQGEIPAEFRDALPDNAVFIH